MYTLRASFNPDAVEVFKDGAPYGAIRRASWTSPWELHIPDLQDYGVVTVTPELATLFLGFVRDTTGDPRLDALLALFC